MTLLRHAVPLGGIFGGQWHPVTALAVFWAESLLLVFATTALCVLIQRRESFYEVKAAGIVPRDVALFFIPSLFGFGFFVGFILLIFMGGGVESDESVEPVRWGEIWEGTAAMLLVVSAGFLLDLWNFDRFTIAGVQARVNECTLRWFLFWMLGFFGLLVLAFTERPSLFLGWFAILKVTFESWAKLARLFGWQSVKERAAPAKESG